MKKQLAKMTALIGLITALALASVSVGQSGANHSTPQASSETQTSIVTDEIDWP
ncbi:hypothetical protein [Streptomyces sp. NBC_00102]|uniref:hypothetical protein n=1 Tax=Streptomyces sp. NBC_00102 TaxID=2975652 RepID=UPI00225837E9|nr:hypothetical protein [Streptomyces sp. NBC_00102]MCX5400282.1 hypothetical protein [Streptomyces sp. NBC_00102]